MNTKTEDTEDTKLNDDANTSRLNAALSAFQDFAAADQHTHTRTGKIARLPNEIREQVNHMLRTGLQYSEISSVLESLGHPGINAPNLSAWKHGGYIDWLRERQRRDEALSLPLALEHCSRTVKLDQIQQNALTIALNRLTEILLSFDPERASDLLHQRPELFPAFLASLSSLSRCHADLTKSFEQANDRERSLRNHLILPETDGAKLAEPTKSSEPAASLDYPDGKQEFSGPTPRLDLGGDFVGHPATNGHADRTTSFHDSASTPIQAFAASLNNPNAWDAPAPEPAETLVHQTGVTRTDSAVAAAAPFSDSLRTASGIKPASAKLSSIKPI